MTGSTTPPSLRRLVENEKLARSINRRIEAHVAEIRDQEGDDDADGPILFFCECADATCRERFRATAEEYDAVHRRPDHFVVVQGHENTSIEVVVDHLRRHLIVRKLADVAPG